MKKYSNFAIGLLFFISFALVFPFSGTAQGDVIRWKMQTVDDPGLMEYQAISGYFADRVRELSNGRLDIQVFPPGGLVPTFEVWDAVRKNMIQISQHYLVYWSGKDAALKASNELAVVSDKMSGMIWLYQGGGLDIVRKITEKHGIFFLGATPMEGENIWSKTPLKSIEDLKGKKIRAAGLAADTFTALGASVVTVPGGEIYSALERGVIDAAEFTTPTVNYGYGFHEVAKYVVKPQYTAGNYYEWIVNQKAWNDLPEDLKEIVIVSLNDTSLMYWLKLRLETERVWKRLVEEHGVTVNTWSEEDMNTLFKTRVEIMKDYAKANEKFAVKFESQMELLRHLGYEE